MMIYDLTCVPARPGGVTCRCPTKGGGEEETKRLSVRIPVSTLWNSSRVWSPAIWPGERGRRTRERGCGESKEEIERCRE